MALYNYSLFSGDGSVNQISTAVPLQYATGFAIQAFIAGSANGSITLYGSCDPSPGNSNYVGSPTNWVAIANGTALVASNSPFMLNVGKAFYSWIQAVYTANSGTGTLNINFNSKDSS